MFTVEADQVVVMSFYQLLYKTVTDREIEWFQSNTAVRMDLRSSGILRGVDCY